MDCCPPSGSEAVGRIFLLSPANCGGTRARQLLAPGSRSALAARLRGVEGVPIGELFVFMSGLYFRGKLTYARRFGVAPDTSDGTPCPAVHVITPNAGLRLPDVTVTAQAVRRFAETAVAPDNLDYRRPLEASARRLAAESGRAEVVLLGSIATPKYVDVLLDVFGERLRFPAEFVGRGDMSRGGLLLRHAAAGVELAYTPVAGAVRHGQRPPRLQPLRGGVVVPGASAPYEGESV